ncbi:MAG: hypothetical protein K0S47_3044 [Herbinix sp.]|jgi:hypothetical protein|nr:hypothetical protein [Herbinix sp.]
MKKAELFLDQYKTLEKLVTSTYKLASDGTAISQLERRPEFRKMKAELSYCREVRNLLQHNPKVGEDYAVEPSDSMIKLLSDIIEKIKNPMRGRDIAIPFQKVYWKSLEDLVLPTMKDMKNNVYTHVPMLQDGKVIGVFSDNSLFSYILEEEIVSIDNATKFLDIKKYLPLDRHPSEIFRFAKYDDLLSDIETLFEVTFDHKERIGMVFLTENGKETERIQGILTPWDIIGN